MGERALIILRLLTGSQTPVKFKVPFFFKNGAWILHLLRIRKVLAPNVPFKKVNFYEVSPGYYFGNES
jgi:hypothetical protein